MRWLRWLLDEKRRQRNDMRGCKTDPSPDCISLVEFSQAEKAEREDDASVWKLAWTGGRELLTRWETLPPKQRCR